MSVQDVCILRLCVRCSCQSRSWSDVVETTH